MAKDLSNAEGIGSDSNFLNGDIVDGQTIVGAHINQDVVQFFQKLMDDASLTPNGDFDNETNGYQFISALVSKIDERTFNDRGDISSADFTSSTNLTLDGTWRDLDLSTIIPNNAYSVLIRVYSTTSSTAIGDGVRFSLRKKGHTGLFSESRHQNVSQIASTINNYTDHYLSLGSFSRLEYNGNLFGNGINGLQVMVAGYSY